MVARFVEPPKTVFIVVLTSNSAKFPISSVLPLQAQIPTKFALKSTKPDYLSQCF